MLAILALLSRFTDDGTATEPVGTFADRRLRRLRRKVEQLATAARPDDPAALHALRIGIKRLRYALEFFTPLSARQGPRATRRPARRSADDPGATERPRQRRPAADELHRRRPRACARR